MSARAAQWVISVYALLFGSLLLFAGRLADRIGHRRLFAIGLGAFGVGSALCGVAQSGAMLVAARAGTGAAAALTVPAAPGLLVSGTDEERRHRALGWWTAAGAAGTVAGLAVGGVLADVAGWRAAFALPAAASIGCLLLVPAIGAADDADDRRPLGAVLVGRLGAARTFAGALALLVAMPLAACAIAADGGEAVLLFAWALDGLGLGCAAVVATTVGTSGSAPDDRGFAAGLINTATQIGTAVSVALLVPFAAAVADDAVVGLRIAFVAIAAIAAAGGAAVLALLRRREG